jgi:hypothetical protein
MASERIKCGNPSCGKWVSERTIEIVEGRILCFPCWCDHENARVRATDAEHRAAIDAFMARS